MDPIAVARHKRDFRVLARYASAKTRPAQGSVSFGPSLGVSHGTPLTCGAVLSPSHCDQSMLTVCDAINRFYKDDLSARIKKGLATRRRRLRGAAKLKVGG
jgi:hypothetical protein